MGIEMGREKKHVLTYVPDKSKQRERKKESEIETPRVRINKRKCNEFPNMLNCLPNKETERRGMRRRRGRGIKHVCNRYANEISFS